MLTSAKHSELRHKLVNCTIRVDFMMTVKNLIFLKPFSRQNNYRNGILAREFEICPHSMFYMLPNFALYDDCQSYKN